MLALKRGLVNLLVHEIPLDVFHFLGDVPHLVSLPRPIFIQLLGLVLGHFAQGGLLCGHLCKFLGHAPRLLLSHLALVGPLAHLLLHLFKLLAQSLLHLFHIPGFGGGRGASRSPGFFAIAGPRLFLCLLLLHLLQRLVQQKREVVEGRHHVLLVHRDVGGLTVSKPIQRLGHVSVHQTNFTVHGSGQLRDAHAQLEQAVFDHHSVVLQFSLGLAMTDVPGVLFVGEFQVGHQTLLFEREGQDVFQQCTQRVHVFTCRL